MELETSQQLSGFFKRMFESESQEQELSMDKRLLYEVADQALETHKVDYVRSNFTIRRSMLVGIKTENVRGELRLEDNVVTTTSYGVETDGLAIKFLRSGMPERNLFVIKNKSLVGFDGKEVDDKNNIEFALELINCIKTYHEMTKQLRGASITSPQ